MVYIKITKIALSYPRFQFSFQGAFDTVEVLRKPPAASTTPAAPPPALPLPVPSGGPNKLRAFMHGGDHEDPPSGFSFVPAPMSSLENQKTSAPNQPPTTTTRHSAMGQCDLAPPFASTAYVAFASRWWGARGESM